MHNITFKGYTNVLAIQKVPVDDMVTSYIAVKLNDEGENDLTKFREIRKLQGLRQNPENDDILTMIHVANNYSEDIYFCDKSLCWGEQLNIAREKYIPQIISESKFKDLESLHLKIYTLLASLTKRMTNDKFENEDGDMIRVIKTLLINLQKLNRYEFNLFSTKEAMELTVMGCKKMYRFQSLAAKFNKKIMQTMTAYFK